MDAATLLQLDAADLRFLAFLSLALAACVFAVGYALGSLVTHSLEFRRRRSLLLRAGRNPFSPHH